MSAIGPGDFVVRLFNADGVPAMRPGTVWCVSSIYETPPGFGPCDYCGQRLSCLLLVNDPEPPNDEWGAWCPCGFKPYHGPEQSTLVKAREVEDA